MMLTSKSLLPILTFFIAVLGSFRLHAQFVPSGGNILEERISASLAHQQFFGSVERHQTFQAGRATGLVSELTRFRRADGGTPDVSPLGPIAFPVANCMYIFHRFPSFAFRGWLSMDSQHLVRELIQERTKLLGFIWAIVRDRHLAEDVFQDVTVLAMERAAEIRDQQHLLLLARQAARYKALELMRKNAHHRLALDNDVLEMVEAEWVRLDSFSSSDEVDHLRACMGQLTPYARQILHLRYNAGLTGIQVAGVVNVKATSVYMALTRIHQTLADCIRRRRRQGDSVHG
jgi:RNA polymerase sigma-70 factor (ECF subfamily)